MKSRCRTYTSDCVMGVEALDAVEEGEAEVICVD
jgi:hypothetical protein